MKRIGEMLKDWRSARGLTLKEMSTRLRISVSTLSRLENGHESDTKTVKALMLWIFSE